MGSTFRIATSTLKNFENGGGICPDECNFGSNQGTCDLQTGTCMCCPGFSGDACELPNTEERCSTSATYGPGAPVSDHHCFNSVISARTETGTGTGTEATGTENCGYPNSATWVDVCYVKYPEKIADVI